MKFYEFIFLFLTYSWYILYGLVFLNFFNHNTKLYFSLIDYYYKLFVGLSLLYFFNPFTTVKFNSFHKQLIISASLFLIMSTTLKEFIINTDTLMNVILPHKNA